MHMTEDFSTTVTHNKTTSDNLLKVSSTANIISNTDQSLSCSIHWHVAGVIFGGPLADIVHFYKFTYVLTIPTAGYWNAVIQVT